MATSCAPKSVKNEKSSVIPSVEEQRVSLEKRANQGNVSAQVALGELYENGTFGSENKFKSTKWFYKAAEQGDIKSQWKLGLMYLYGDNFPKNSQKAVKWLTKSANQNYRMAQLSLAFMYRDGNGVTKDKVKAEQYYKRACSDIDFSNMALPHPHPHPHPDTVPGQCLIFNDFKGFKYN